ncbi:hypothetical protein CsatB_026147 [Cannabis sativa]
MELISMNRINVSKWWGYSLHLILLTLFRTCVKFIKNMYSNKLKSVHIRILSY